MEIIFTDLPAGRVFGMDAQTFLQIFFNFIFFAILAIVMALLLYRPVRDYLRKRNDAIQDQLKQAEDTMEKASELKREYEQKISDIAAERDDVLSAARKRADEASRAIIVEAKKEADAIRERAVAEVSSQWEQVGPGVKDAVIAVSASMAEKFVSLSISKETYDKLFAEAIADVEGNIYAANHR